MLRLLASRRALAVAGTAGATALASRMRLVHCSADSAPEPSQPPPGLEPPSTRPSAFSEDPEHNAEILEQWRTRIGEAREAFGRSDVDGAERALLQAITDAEHFGRSSPPMATSLLNLAQLYRRAGRLGEAEPLLARAAEVLETTAGPNNKVTLLALMDLANTRLERGDAAAAAGVFDDALNRLEQAEEKQPAGRAALRAVRAGCLLQAAKADALIGRDAVAEARLRVAAELVAERWGADSARLVPPYLQLAALLFRGGRDEEARELCDRAERHAETPAMREQAGRVREARGRDLPATK